MFPLPAPMRAALDAAAAAGAEDEVPVGAVPPSSGGAASMLMGRTYPRDPPPRQGHPRATRVELSRVFDGGTRDNSTRVADGRTDVGSQFRNRMPDGLE